MTEKLLSPGEDRLSVGDEDPLPVDHLVSQGRDHLAQGEQGHVDAGSLLGRQSHRSLESYC